ncbi:hypothetical protein BC351_00800 [Paenibacillus ferrarius]|uniref:Uncharacterized protein n=1 Tax=Paenibacillus ferrarius TaxID=1469647 RepID=A0A1V4HSA1_9BACL|nr:hypothetical protein [Paenibacillus ferrarius]OPH61811.1 hypothetical protein BC351_00800 [Paenibacillus ferrarius]
MTNIPNEIQEAIKNSAKYHEKAKEQHAVLKTWIQNNFGESAIDDDIIRDTIVNLIEQANDPLGAIRILESALDNYKYR